MQESFTHRVASNFLVSDRQDASPNPMTFNSAKYNVYGSTAFGEVRLRSNPALTLK